MNPVLCWKVIEGKQDVPVFQKTGSGCGILCIVTLKEVIECFLGGLLSLGHPDLMQIILRSRLDAFRQLVQNVSCFVHPASLPSGLAEDLRQSLPEAERTVSDREFRSGFKSSP